MICNYFAYKLYPGEELKVKLKVKSPGRMWSNVSPGKPTTDPMKHHIDTLSIEI